MVSSDLNEEAVSFDVEHNEAMTSAYVSLLKNNTQTFKWLCWTENIKNVCHHWQTSPKITPVCEILLTQKQGVSRPPTKRCMN